jgi:hypothetical protein
MQRITKYIQIICNRKRLSRDKRLRLMEHERALTPCRSPSSRNREAISGTVIDYTYYQQTIPALANAPKSATADLGILESDLG